VITSNLTQVYPFEVFLFTLESGLPKPSKDKPNKVRTISKQRIRGQIIGNLNQALMELVDRVIKLHFAL